MGRNKRIQKKILKIIATEYSKPKQLPSFYQKEFSKILKSKEVIINGVPVIHPGFMN